MFKKFMLVIMITGAVIFMSGCGDKVEPDEPEIPDNSQDALPAKVENWVDYSSALFLGQSFQHEGKLYLLVAYGEKPTGGYTVEVTDISKEDEKLVVTAYFTSPAEDEMVSQAFTYPYDLKVIADPGLPVEFIATGAETYLPTLYGLDRLKPVTAGSEWIRLFAPASGETIGRQITVEGIANVFEGTVIYTLTNAKGEELETGFTTGAMGDWGYFSIDLELGEQIESGSVLLLQLYTESPMDGSIQDMVEVELKLE